MGATKLCKQIVVSACNPLKQAVMSVSQTITCFLKGIISCHCVPVGSHNYLMHCQQLQPSFMGIYLCIISYDFNLHGSGEHNLHWDSYVILHEYGVYSLKPCSTLKYMMKVSPYFQLGMQE